jgi:hypothetical protein
MLWASFFHRYIDDLLSRHRQVTVLHRHTQVLRDLLCQLGWGVNVLKSMLNPSQDFEYFGVRYLTHLGLMTPPLDRFLKIWDRVRLLRQGPVTARVALSVIGLLVSAERQVLSGRLNFRALQVYLRAQFRMGVHSLDYLVSFHNDPSVLQALDWWSLPENVFRGQSLGPFLQHRTLFTEKKSHDGSHDGSSCRHPTLTVRRQLSGSSTVNRQPSTFSVDMFDKADLAVAFNIFQALLQTPSS